MALSVLHADPCKGVIVHTKCIIVDEAAARELQISPVIRCRYACMLLL